MLTLITSCSAYLIMPGVSIGLVISALARPQSSLLAEALQTIMLRIGVCVFEYLIFTTMSLVAKLEVGVVWVELRMKRCPKRDEIM